MTIINLPSGSSINFEDASKEQIEASLLLLQENEPDLFKEPEISEEDYIKSLSAEQAIAYGQERYGAGSTDAEDSNVPDVPITVDAQVTGLDRYEFGKADRDDEREQFLTNTYGAESFGKDNRGRYYLKLDNISPEIKPQRILKTPEPCGLTNPEEVFSVSLICPMSLSSWARTVVNSLVPRLLPWRPLGLE